MSIFKHGASTARIVAALVILEKTLMRPCLVPEDEGLGDPESTVPLDGKGLVEDGSNKENLTI